VFRSYGTEAMLYFTCGKIAISSIVIEEIEVEVGPSESEEEDPSEMIGIATLKVAAYGIYEGKACLQEYRGLS
jgi:hypothetical protein